MLHDVSGSAAENRLPQPVPCEGSLDEQIAAVRLGRSENRFSSAPAIEFDAHQFGGLLYPNCLRTSSADGPGTS